MKAAMLKDTQTLLGKISANFRGSHPESPQQSPENDRMRVIESHILRSLTEPPYAIVRREQVAQSVLYFDPICVLEAMTGSLASIPEILWNLSHCALIIIHRRESSHPRADSESVLLRRPPSKPALVFQAHGQGLHAHYASPWQGVCSYERSQTRIYP
jgi:hypothetical protein